MTSHLFEGNDWKPVHLRKKGKYRHTDKLACTEAYNFDTLQTAVIKLINFKCTAPIKNKW
jgi:hypothetical protein